jgi:hypothetical protein
LCTVQCMIAKDHMKIGDFLPIFLERVPPGGADMHSRVK